MLPLERQNEIIEILNKRKAASVEELCNALYSSGATIRRDLALLENAGIIKRTHGGAVLIDSGSRESPLMLRENENTRAKRLIAGRALKHIKDGQTIFIDSSSTCCALAGQLAVFSGLRVITNSLKTVNILSDIDGVTAYCTGGRLRERAFSFVGSRAVRFINDFHADSAFISCRGVDIESGVTESSEEEAEIKSAYLKNSDSAFLLFDGSKLGKRYFCKICGLEDISLLISNAPVPEKYASLPGKRRR